MIWTFDRSLQTFIYLAQICRKQRSGSVDVIPLGGTVEVKTANLLPASREGFNHKLLCFLPGAAEEARSPLPQVLLRSAGAGAGEEDGRSARARGRFIVRIFHILTSIWRSLQPRCTAWMPGLNFRSKHANHSRVINPGVAGIMQMETTERQSGGERGILCRPSLKATVCVWKVQVLLWSRLLVLTSRRQICWKGRLYFGRCWAWNLPFTPNRSRKFAYLSAHTYKRTMWQPSWILTGNPIFK